MTNNLLADKLFLPVSGAKRAKFDINIDTGSVTIDHTGDDEQALASGTLEYFEKQGKPTLSVTSDDGEASLTLKGYGAGQPWFRFPWTACTEATEWRIHLNPTVSSDITAHTGGGNLTLDLAGMAITRVSADTGGGNVEVVLPDHEETVTVTARTGAGNVTIDIGSDIAGTNAVEADTGAGNVAVRVPDGIAARVHASTGLGKVVVDPRFSMIDRHTYESPDYDIAADRVDITVKSGAGNAIVSTK